MGWSHSPRLAQAAHEHVLDTHTTLRHADRICADNDTVVDRERHQVYIDDLILFGYDAESLAATQQRYIDAVRHVGLVVKDTKVVLPSSHGVVCLGLEVHEEPRIARPSPRLPDQIVEPGMVFTIEPGAYVPGVGGVRIEDDVLVTATGCEVLTRVEAGS